MPELPEVETIARGVDARRAATALSMRGLLLSQTIQDAGGAAERRPRGASVVSVHRRGKHIVCELAEAPKESRRSKAELNRMRNGLFIWE